MISVCAYVCVFVCYVCMYWFVYMCVSGQIVFVMSTVVIFKLEREKKKHSKSESVGS